MLQIGDTVKVIKPANNDGELREYIKIGTICCITEIGHEKDGTPYYGLLPLNSIRNIRWFYLEDEFKKCQAEWTNKHAGIKDVKNLPFATKIKIISSDGHEHPAVVFGDKIGFANGWYMYLEDIKDRKIYLA